MQKEKKLLFTCNVDEKGIVFMPLKSKSKENHVISKKIPGEIVVTAKVYNTSYNGNIEKLVKFLDKTFKEKLTYLFLFTIIKTSYTIMVNDISLGNTKNIKEVTPKMVDEKIDKETQDVIRVVFSGMGQDKAWPIMLNLINIGQILGEGFIRTIAQRN